MSNVWPCKCYRSRQLIQLVRAFASHAAGMQSSHQHLPFSSDTSGSIAAAQGDLHGRPQRGQLGARRWVPIAVRKRFIVLLLTDGTSNEGCHVAVWAMNSTQLGRLPHPATCSWLALVKLARGWHGKTHRRPLAVSLCSLCHDVPLQCVYCSRVCAAVVLSLLHPGRCGVREASKAGSVVHARPSLLRGSHHRRRIPFTASNSRCICPRTHAHTHTRTHQHAVPRPASVLPCRPCWRCGCRHGREAAASVLLVLLDDRTADSAVSSETAQEELRLL
jgi:hypothetical protein